ncbi:hypothetical protein FJZ41_01965, partial [Candidatus Shapirobacteria bacterium]|nr:hypothetical protein [Candidatus Shapirobacteria bacterium]
MRSLPNLPKIKLKREKPSLVKGNLATGEKLKINLGDYQADETVILVYDSSGQEIELKNEQTEDGQIAFNLPNTFRPGKYHLKIINKTTSEVLVEQDFTWGVLAINPNKSIYLPGETAKLAMAVLDERGMMVCDANLTLKITNPEGQTKELSTNEGTIIVNPECLMHSYTEQPDYEASYQTDKVGAYQLELLAETSNGKFTINDSLEVRDYVEFDIERTGPTRIYPPATYPVEFKIKANQDFEGVIEETVPSSFDILPLEENSQETADITEMTLEELAQVFDQGKILGLSSRSYTDVEEKGDIKIIRWYASLKRGEEISLGYRFDAPDISPQFYLLGPLKFIKTDNQVVFQETRRWQIAVDGACTSKATGNWSAGTTWNTGCSGVGGVPTSADDVTISVSNIVTVDAAAAANSVTIAQQTGNNQQNDLNINSGITLTVTNAVTIPAQNYNKNSTVGVGSGTLSAGSISITGGSRASIVSASSGTITVTGGISFSGTAANAQLTTTSTATINLTGTLGSGGTLSINSGTTLYATGTSAISGAYTLGGLTVSSGTTTLGAAVTAAGAVAVSSGAYLTMGDFAFTASSTTGITGTINTATGSTGTRTFTGLVTIN